MADKVSFLMYHRHLELFKQLTNEQAGILIKAVMAYEVDGTLPSFGQDALLIGFFFGVFKPYLDENQEEYKKKCKKNSANASKRWGSKANAQKNKTKTQNVQTDANAYDSMQTDANYADRIGKDRIGEDRIGEEEEKEEADASSAPALDMNPIIDFYNQNIGCCTAYIRDCLVDTATQYGIPNTLRACELACERGKRTLGYIDATAKGLFTVGEFKPKSEDVPKQEESYASELARLCEEKLKEWENEPLEFEEEIMDGTG